MAVGRIAATAQLEAVMEAGTTTPYALPGNMRKWDRDSTPTDDFLAVFYQRVWAGDDEWRPQGWTGGRRLSSFRVEYALSTLVQVAESELGQGPASLGKQSAEERIESYWEKLRHRVSAEAHWSAGTTGIVDVRDVRKVGREALHAERLEHTFSMTVVLDEDVG